MKIKISHAQESLANKKILRNSVQLNLHYLNKHYPTISQMLKLPLSIEKQLTARNRHPSDNNR